ncbi:type ISP restriction/modification enzyme [Rathayibacter sp. AY1D9]|uniref:DEAD/DEAH box helicase n=1 Tax=Rathayibacter sp. AY1D9 TaxID=2080548 RepID=UPI000CE78E1A|nr:type ISP restriction/modification enzyme [Rathayibacter sp. AY1D9]PPH80469.1 damage-inducible protein [Rathayibacter sp. AY1D9]
MTTIHDLLSEYASIARDTREKGLLLERLTRAYLTTEPQWTAQFDEVWLWQDWPGRQGRPDTGIDLVAHERFGGGYCAIQCKFYAPTHTIQKADLDSFFTASGKSPFTTRMVVSTSTKWSKHAVDALEEQYVNAYRVGINELAESEIDWSSYSFAKPDEVNRAPGKILRPHQQDALERVQEGFEDNERGKLLMACGTGKTFTGLRIAEAVAGAGGSVLFLVPSIALLSQTLKEWSAERAMPLRAFAICSDSKVGKNAEDFSVSDLAFPATTSTEQLLTEVAKAETPDGLTVYFSTYQSIDVVSRAQMQGLPEFDLVICDEAHRTAGFTLAGDASSAFLRVHDDQAIKTKRRLYMTATPKIYAESVRAQAADKAAVLVSMDDEAVFGPIFHRLGFGEAVERNLLTDYRVIVLAVDEGSVSAAFQEQFATDGALNIPDAARIVGIYNGLAKRGVQGIENTPVGLAPLRRAVAFSRSIADSKKVTELLDGYDGDADQPLSIAGQRIDETADGAQVYRLESQHVDGTMNVLQRTELLDWLKADTGEDVNVCRILTNARCLSEGVDVPALDAVIFLNSRDSQVDVVQSVGRVMRRAEGKDYGYIVLPIAVPAGVTPEQALNDNAKFKVVWDVLRALRAHDERFEAKIEQIDLNGKTADGPVLISDLRDPQFGEAALRDEKKRSADPDTFSTTLDWTALGADWRDAIYAKIVDKVGERDYWENWAKDVADIASRHQIRIRGLVDGSNEELHATFEAFVSGLRDNLNPSITEGQAIEMLSQHLITQPVFDALFSGHAFSDHNPVSLVMQHMLDALENSNLETETSDLEAFYAGVRRSVTGITDAAGKQTTIKRLYEKFFSGAFRGTSERLGIVYTPNEIVDFIIASADELSREHFGVGLTDEGVHVLDPFTGTGTFIVRLLQSGLVDRSDLRRKFREELHSNEIVLLAYYVAAVNIEATYASLAGAGAYEAFPGIVLTDTFQSSEDDDRYDDGGIFGDNNERVKAQNELDIRVIIGNPPYSSGQDSANDNNQNLKYPSLDKRIADTYAAKSTAQNKNSLYDSYIRAIRWASDRIKDRGIVGFVTNGGFLDGNTADGLRASLADEFTELYVLNLRGNTRTSGEQARKEGGQTFGPGSRATVVISLLVKNPDRVPSGAIRYHDIGDYLSAERKLSLLREAGSVSEIEWVNVRPNEHGDWLNQRSNAFTKFTGLEDVFCERTQGITSSRDAWVYGSSRDQVTESVQRTIKTYTSTFPSDGGNSIADDPTQISWSRKLRRAAVSKMSIEFDPDRVRTSSYRPFNRQYLYLDPQLNEVSGQIAKAHPKEGANYGIYYTSPSTHYPAFAAIMVDAAPDLHLLDTGRYLPRYLYEQPAASAPTLFDEDSGRIDNITDSALARYRQLYGAEVSADDVFFFTYGLLHSVDYRTEFAADLKKMLPRIPELEAGTDFWAFAAAGRELSALHIGYEQVAPYPVNIAGDTGGPVVVTSKKMRFGGKAGAWDRSTIKVTDSITITGVPEQAHEYMLGSRSAIEWIFERYVVKTDKSSGIVNDPNLWGTEHGNTRYILDLLLRIITVSVETVKIVNGLPTLKYVVPE